MRILCSLGPSCMRVAHGQCPMCHGHYCPRHSGHGTGHATHPKDWADCGHPLINEQPLCEKKEA